MKTKTKIVILIDWYLPGTKAGGPVRSIYSLVSLIKDLFDITIITTNYDLGSKVPYPNIKPDKFYAEDGLNFYYFSESNLNPDQVIKVINQLAPDIIYLNSFWSYPFSIGIVQANKKNPLLAKIILAPRGMLSKGAMGLKSSKKIMYLILAKTMNWYKGLSFHATNDQEEKDIRKHFKKNPILRAPNINSGVIKNQSRTKTKNQLRLFYLSRISPVKNLHFAIEVLAQIPKQVSIVYDIYGNKEDEHYWSECESLIRSLPSNIRVNLRGEIPFSKVQDVIADYHALFLPTLNENYGHAIVESLLSGCPVIISDQTPWKDLETDGAGFAIPLSQKQKFVGVISDIATLDQAGFNLISQSAIDYIRKKINLDQIIQQYKILFDAKN